MANASQTLAPAVDLQRFMGRWYLLARIPYFGERGEVGSYREYGLRGDGDIDAQYFAHASNFEAPLKKKSLKAHVEAGNNNARWRASTVWPLSCTQLILYVDPGYQYALIGDPERRRGWIVARSPAVSDQVYRDLLVRFYTEGYDTARFERVAQTAEQIGLPGYRAP